MVCVDKKVLQVNVRIDVTMTTKPVSTFKKKVLLKNPCDILINFGKFCQKSGDGRNQIFPDFEYTNQLQ